MFSYINLLAAILLATTTASAATIKILSGESGLTYSPNSTTAAVGDILEFHFYPRAHDVVMGAFSSPCNAQGFSNGFASGYVPVTSGVSPTVFRVTVNDTKPIWYYCSQTKHCQLGMVGVVNPAASGNSTLAAYAAAAARTNSSYQPTGVEGGVLVKTAATNGSTTGSTTGTNSSASGNATMPNSGAEVPVGLRLFAMLPLVALGTVVAYLL